MCTVLHIKFFFFFYHWIDEIYKTRWWILAVNLVLTLNRAFWSNWIWKKLFVSSHHKRFVNTLKMWHSWESSLFRKKKFALSNERFWVCVNEHTGTRRLTNVNRDLIIIKSYHLKVTAFDLWITLSSLNT